MPNQYKLIITSATKQELPLTWLNKLNYPVFTIKALQAGILNSSKHHTSLDKGILFIITGVGEQASSNTAQWIKQHLNPLFVVNIGTTGTLHKKLSLGQWLIPTYVANEKNETIKLNTQLPFSLTNLSQKSAPIYNKSLLSISQPLFQNHPQAWFNYDSLDMEAFAQAQIFHNTDISFSVLKQISDYSDAQTSPSHQIALTKIQTDLQNIFAFLQNNQQPPHFSVIIPVYNRAQQIITCLNSVLDQTFPAQEIIIVNDGSTDNTLQILQNLKHPQLKIITLNQNQGVSSARNHGIAAAHNNWLCFLDSDDLWQKNKLEKQAAYIQKYPFYQILQSKEVWFRNQQRINSCKHHTQPEGWIFEPCLKLCLISPSGVVIHKNIFQNIGLFDESLPVCEDYDLWLRISRHYPVGLEASNSIIKHGGHPDQLSHKYQAMDRFRVQSLLKLYHQEPDQAYQKIILPILNKKLHILLQGAQKRNLKTQVQEYQAQLKSLGLAFNYN